MTYREFITKLCGIYTFSKGMIEVYNEAFKGKTEFSDYWKKFVTEYNSSEKIPMPSFWLKEEKPEPVDTEDRSKDYNLAEITKQRLAEETAKRWERRESVGSLGDIAKHLLERK